LLVVHVHSLYGDDFTIAIRLKVRVLWHFWRYRTYKLQHMDKLKIPLTVFEKEKMIRRLVVRVPYPAVFLCLLLLAHAVPCHCDESSSNLPVVDNEDTTTTATLRGATTTTTTDTDSAGGANRPPAPVPLVRQLQDTAGPGCRFTATDGTVTTFDEGQSMGNFAMVSSCANNIPEAFPCYCISSAPQQTVCPYCFYRDTFNQVICGRGDNTIGILHPNRTFVQCGCDVAVTPSTSSYQVTVTSNCDIISDVSATFASVLQTSSPYITDMDTTPAPVPVPGSFMTWPPVVTITANPGAPVIPVTPNPTTAAPITVPVTVPQPPVAAPTTTTAVPGGTLPPVSNNLAEVITYQPGNLTTYSMGLWMSHGLSAKILARAGQPVPYTATSTINVARAAQSTVTFHERPDGAAIFDDQRPDNPGGYIHVQNSEVSAGSVSAMTFNANGDIIDYKRVLTGTKENCNGGKTPWGTWITAEEDFDKAAGRAWQVDPLGIRQAKPITLGAEGGTFEAFAYDIRDLTKPRFFLTEDSEEGALRRWTPTNVQYGMDPWELLHGTGVTDYLVLNPDFASNGAKGTFSWTTDLKEAQKNAKDFYPSSEGIEADPPDLYFVTKNNFKLFKLNLDTMTYEMSSTRAGLMDGEPDQIKMILRDDGTKLLYFSEDWGRVAGIHARDESGKFFTVLEGPDYEPGTYQTT